MLYTLIWEPMLYCNTPIFNISLLILLLDNISINVIISIGC